MSRVALIGLGRMGLPICRRLLQAGHTVLAVDLKPDRVQAAAAAGALPEVSAQAATDAADVVLTILPGGPELDEVMLGAGDLLARLSPGQLWIDMTSAGADLGRRLAAAAAAQGVSVLEAPLGGGVPAAEEGGLTLYVGGEAATLATARPLLEAVAAPDRVWHMGGPGTGYLTKLLVNLLWFGQALAVGEAMLLAQREHLDLRQLRQVVMAGPAGSEFVRSCLPALFEGDYLTSFGLDRCVEELQSLQTAAAGHYLPFELSSLVADLHVRALEQFGPIDGELMGIAHLESRAGNLIRPQD